MAYSPQWQHFRFLADAFVTKVVHGESLKFDYLGDANGSTCYEIKADGSIETSFFLEITTTDQSPCNGYDWYVLLYLWIVVHCISWGGRWLFYEPFARWHMNAKLPDSATQKTIENFSQSLTAASFHLAMGVMAWQILHDKEWIRNKEAWADPDSFQCVDADLKFYYLLYAARYSSDLVSLLFEHPRSDTPAYAIHHVATIVLVLYSAHVGATRMGGVFMIFLDWADPPLLLAKALVYLSRKPTDWYQWWADRLFEVFAVLFFLSRNLLMSYIVYVICFEFDIPTMSATSLKLLRSMLIVLVLLMTFWLYLIIQAAINQASNQGNVEDIREEEVQHKHKKE